MPQQITGHFTCDNSYSVWVGDVNGVVTKLLEATNYDAQAVWDGEDLPPINLVPGDYIYAVGMSDIGTWQGFLGSFTGAVRIDTGDPRWSVLPTGRYHGPGDFPDINEINLAIASALPADWVVPFVGAPNVPPPAGGLPWNTIIHDIPSEACWMWHDSGNDPRPKYPQPPYVPFVAFDHDEFLIFRIPCEEFGPIGDISYNCEASTHCGPGRLCFDYSLPTREGPAGQVTGSVTITLDIYQNGALLTQLISPTLTSGNSYCFNITPSSIPGINTALGGFDFVGTGVFAIGNTPLGHLMVGSPPNGITEGRNNDYLIACKTCADIEREQDAYLRRKCGNKVNLLPRINCDCLDDGPEDSSDCRCTCHAIELPNIKPCISIRWGDSKCDCIETDDLEVLCVTVCNCYSNVAFNNLTIGHILITDMAGNPVPQLPDGTPSVQVFPSGPICFGDIGPCKENGGPNCVSRELVLYTRGAVGQDYLLSFEGVCFTVSLQSQSKQCFIVTLCRDE